MTASTEVPKGGSPETQQIIDACYQGSFQSLEGLVAARSKAAEGALDSFLGQADEQGEEFLKAHDTSLQRVEDAFEKYQEALRAVRQAGQSQNAEAAQKAATDLALASFSIRSAVVAYEESFLSFGDSRFPLINLLNNLGERVRGGQVPPQVWQSTCQRYGGYYTKAVEEIDNSQERDKPGVPERRKALANLAELFGKLVSLGPADSRNQYEDLIFEVNGCFVDLSEAVETYHTHVFLTGECKSPHINLLIKVARGVLDGKYDKAVLRALTSDMSDDIQGRLNELDRMTKHPLESEVFNDHVAEMLDVVESLDDGLQALIGLANGEQVDQAELQESLDILAESGDVLAEVNKAVAQYNENQSKVTCPGCGSTQEAGLQTCPSCHAPLPQLANPMVTSSIEVHEGGEDDTGDPVMTTVMQELFQKVDDFDQGSITADDFFDYLDGFEQRLEASEHNLRQIHPPEMPEGLDVEQRAISREFITIAEDALSLLDIGLEECREGVANLRHFAETDEQEAKTTGKQLYYEGVQKMWMVARAQKRVEEFITASAALLGDDGGASRFPSGGAAAPASLSSRFTDQM